MNPTASPLAPAYVLVKKGTTGSCATDDGAGPWAGTMEAYQYDGFGRVVRQARRMPNLQGATNQTYFARKETRYDSAGHVQYSSEWIPCAKQTGVQTTDLANCFKPVPLPADPGNRTAFSNFDPFSRARHIVRPDSSTTDIDFTDGTITHSDSVEKVTVSNVGGTNPVTTTRKDVLGRVISVAQPSVGGATDTTS